ncbi:MAG: hypothetical protein LBB08_01265 [Rickettsiales bacterium]|jgi:hypothetical protein|nr:hypothetical protein [Rickettsiales bacterium]
MKKIASLFSVMLLACCVSYKDYYKLDGQYLARRQLETARFDTNDEAAVLSASAQVLQDLGFTLEESETKLGLVTASKNRRAGSSGAKVAFVLLAALSGTQPVYDTEQKIYTTLVSTKSRESRGYNVRIEFARIVWNNRNQARIEKIQEPEIYRDFFDKLGQSLFLTANAI